MVKFALTSLLGTICDFLSFTFLFTKILPVFWSEICAALVGMAINFFMQKKFVFRLNRNIHTAFLLSIFFSFVFMFSFAFILHTLTKTEYFAQNLILAKVLVMGVKFMLNYFTKHWIFEK